MTPVEDTAFSSVLAGSWTRASIEQQARTLGVFRRKRKMDVWVLLWTLLLSVQVGAKRSLTGIFERYQELTDQSLSYSSFYDWFTPSLAAFLKHLCTQALAQLGPALGMPTGFLAGFRELLAMDATIVRLHDFLAPHYPANRTNHTKAALKLHVVHRPLEGSLRTVRLTSERVGEGTIWRRLGPWVKDCLLLFDLGYYAFSFFARIADNGGFFVCRAKSNFNPRIVAAHRAWRGQSIDVVGQRLQDVLPRLQRDILDVEVEVEHTKRVWRGRRRTVRRRFRLVGMHKEEGGYYLYLTNLPSERLPAEDVCAVYAWRWQVELLFKALRSYGRIHQLPSSKKEVVEALIWSALLAAVVSQRLYRFVRRLVPSHRHLPPLRWATHFARIASEILELLLYPDLQRARRLLATLRRTAPDPNRERPDRSLLGVPTLLEA